MTILRNHVSTVRARCRLLCCGALCICFLLSLLSCEIDPVTNTQKANTSVYRFYELKEIEEQIQLFHKAYQPLTRVHSLSPKTHENRTIYSIKISDNAHIDENEPAVLITGGMHARESISVSTLYLITKHLLQQYSTQKRIQDVVDNYEIWIVLIANPDGYHYARTVDKTWRKNRRDNADGTMGVDLNRNWGFQWDYAPSPDYAKRTTSTSSEIYRGKSAFSEPETQALKQLIEEISPKLFIDYHSFGQLVLYPYGHDKTEKADSTTVSIGKSIAGAISKVHNAVYIPGFSSQLYVHTGTSIDYVYDTYKIPSFVIELRPTFTITQELRGFYGFEHLVQVTFEENLEGFLTAIETVSTN